MIIFTPIRIIPVEMLEYKGIRQVVTYNLSSYFSDVPTLNMLIPSTAYIPEESLEGDCNIPSFDISYHNYLIDSNGAFMQLMNIIIPAYQSPETLVQVLVNDSPFREAFQESLIKLIQQRYGYNICRVNEVEDFLYAEESDFSIPGLFTLDKDIARWHTMVPLESGDPYE